MASEVIASSMHESFSWAQPFKQPSRSSLGPMAQADSALNALNAPNSATPKNIVRLRVIPRLVPSSSLTSPDRF
jgi:hypothetical protein